MALDALFAMLLQVSEGASDRLVECEGTRLAHAESTRGYGAMRPPTPFHAVIRFNDDTAEIVESSDSDVPRRYIGGRVDNGNFEFLPLEGVSWHLTFYRDSGRFEFKNFDMGSTVGGSLITRNGSITGACKAFQKSDVFN
jgi:hypothetical protein